MFTHATCDQTQIVVVDAAVDAAVNVAAAAVNVAAAAVNVAVAVAVAAAADGAVVDAVVAVGMHCHSPSRNHDGSLVVAGLFPQG
jgi:hypothetical protein